MVVSNFTEIKKLWDLGTPASVPSSAWNTSMIFYKNILVKIIFERGMHSSLALFQNQSLLIELPSSSLSLHKH